LDLKKAFDVCSHEILLKKIQKMGIRGTAYNWFKNYLAGRTQFVDINGNKSDPLAKHLRNSRKHTGPDLVSLLH
jgi:hypothetical protein